MNNSINFTKITYCLFTTIIFSQPQQITLEANNNYWYVSAQDTFMDTDEFDHFSDGLYSGRKDGFQNDDWVNAKFRGVANWYFDLNDIVIDSVKLDIEYSDINGLAEEPPPYDTLTFTAIGVPSDSFSWVPDSSIWQTIPLWQEVLKLPFWANANTDIISNPNVDFSWTFFPDDQFTQTLQRAIRNGNDFNLGLILDPENINGKYIGGGFAQITLYYHDVIIANRNILDETLLNGQLTLDHIESTEFDYNNTNSGGTISVIVGDEYNVRTHNELLNFNDLTLKHHSWSTGDSVFKMENNNFEMRDWHNINAYYDQVINVNITSNCDTTIYINDPWWVEPETDLQTGNNWIPIEGNSYPVFLNQNPNVSPAYYSLHAPRGPFITPDGIYMLTGWDGSGVNIGEHPQHVGDISYRTVIFQDTSASLHAIYSPINEIENYTFNPSSDIYFQPGTHISFASGFKFLITGLNSITLDGTENNPIIFDSISDQKWNGIELRTDANLSIMNTKFINAINAITMNFYDNITFIPSEQLIENVVFEGNEFGILFEFYNYGDFTTKEIYINNCQFINNTYGIKYSHNEINGPIPYNNQINTNINNSRFENNEIGFYLNRSANDVEISNSIFENNSSGILFDVNVPESEQTVHQSVIHHNLFIDNDDGIFIQNECYGGNFTIHNNTFYNNTWCGVFKANLGNYQCSAYNNIVLNSDCGIFLDYNDNLEYNLFYNVNQNNPLNGSGNIYDDPLFIDINSENFNLSSLSPCINTGHPDLDNDGIIYETDVDDQDPDGTRMDMGYAHYHQIFGDVNLSGETDVDDITFLVDMILEIIDPLPTQLQIADINYDNDVDIFDLFMLVDSILNETMNYVAPEGTIYYTQITRSREFPPYELTIGMYCDVPVRGLQMTVEIPELYDVATQYISQGEFANAESMDLAYNYVQERTRESIKYLYYSPVANDFDPGNGEILNVGMTLSETVNPGRVSTMEVPGLTIDAMGIGQNGGRLNMIELSPDEFEQMVTSKKQNTIPEDYALHPAFPNPFNPSTTFKYEIPEQSRIQLQIFDITGRLVKTIVNNEVSAGSYSLQWYGLNQRGTPVSAGMYIARMTATSTNGNKSHTQSQKIVLLK